MNKDQQYSYFKKKQLIFFKAQLLNRGGINTQITILGTSKKRGDLVFTFIPIHPKIVESERLKRKFVAEFLPKISAEIKKEIEISVVGFASEAFMQVMNVPDGTNLKDVDLSNRDLQKIECLIISMDNGEKQEILTHQIVRISDEIKLLDSVLVLPEVGVDANFMNLYKKMQEA